MEAVLTKINAGTVVGKLEIGITSMVSTLADPAGTVSGDTLSIDMDTGSEHHGVGYRDHSARVIDALKEFFFPANRKSDRGR